MVIFVRNCHCSSLWRCGPEGLDRTGWEVGHALFLISTLWGQESPLENRQSTDEGKAWGGDPDMREVDLGCQEGGCAEKTSRLAERRRKPKARGLLSLV